MVVDRGGDVLGCVSRLSWPMTGLGNPAGSGGNCLGRCLDALQWGSRAREEKQQSRGGVSTGCAKIALFEDFGGGGVSNVLRSPKSSKGAATGSSREEGD